MQNVPESKVVKVAYWSGRLGELFITKFKSEFKQGLTKVVVTRAGRLQESWFEKLVNPKYFSMY